MKFRIKPNSFLIYHRWQETYKIPDGYRSVTTKGEIEIPADKLLHDPHKGNGGWTELAHKRKTAGNMLGDCHPIFEDNPEGLSHFLHIEQEYYVFEHEYPGPDVDLIAVHKENVEVVDE